MPRENLGEHTKVRVTTSFLRGECSNGSRPAGFIVAIDPSGNASLTINSVIVAGLRVCVCVHLELSNLPLSLSLLYVSHNEIAALLGPWCAPPHTGSLSFSKWICECGRQRLFSSLSSSSRLAYCKGTARYCPNPLPLTFFRPLFFFFPTGEPIDRHSRGHLQRAELLAVHLTKHQ